MLRVQMQFDDAEVIRRSGRVGSLPGIVAVSKTAIRSENDAFAPVRLNEAIRVTCALRECPEGELPTALSRNRLTLSSRAACTTNRKR